MSHILFNHLPLYWAFRLFPISLNNKWWCRHRSCNIFTLSKYPVLSLGALLQVEMLGQRLCTLWKLFMWELCVSWECLWEGFRGTLQGPKDMLLGTKLFFLKRNKNPLQAWLQGLAIWVILILFFMCFYVKYFILGHALLLILNFLTK